MEKQKLVAGIFVFGSLWGFAECILGSWLRDMGLPAGALMTGVFALGLLMFSRMRYQVPGMQLGMGLVAGTLRLVNPFGGCFLCSAIAIMAEGAVFELLYLRVSFTWKPFQKLLYQSSLGIILSYSVYVTGYVVTQILTPVVAGAGFYISNLIAVFPSILGSGLLAALIGGVTVPVVFASRQLSLSLKERLYYPTTIGVGCACWGFVLLKTFLLMG